MSEWIGNPAPGQLEKAEEILDEEFGELDPPRKSFENALRDALGSGQD